MLYLLQCREYTFYHELDSRTLSAVLQCAFTTAMFFFMSCKRRIYYTLRSIKLTSFVLALRSCLVSYLLTSLGTQRCPGESYLVPTKYIFNKFISFEIIFEHFCLKYYLYYIVRVCRPNTN